MSYRSILLLFVLLLPGCARGGATADVTGSTISPERSGEAAAAPRLFELRTYTAPPGRLAELQNRFRDHTVALFEKHGMVNIGYWTPVDSDRANNTLIYLLAYPSRDARERSWEAFFADPEWRAARANSEANGPIVERVESVFLTPAEFSQLQ